MDLAGLTAPQVNLESGNIPENWRRFRQHVDLMFTGPLNGKNESEKISFLLLWVGDKGRDIFNTFELSADNRKKLEKVYEAFDNYVRPRSNRIHARFKFLSRTQNAGESFDDLITDLKLLVRDCEYGDQSDDQVRDRIVIATNSHRVREKLINEGNKLTLTKAIEMAKCHEIAQAHIKSIEGDRKTVESIHKTSSASPRHRGKQMKQYNTKSQGSAYKKQNDFKTSFENNQSDKSGRSWTKDDRKSQSTCLKCGNARHKFLKDCPANGFRCRRCNCWGHFEKVCLSKQVHSLGVQNGIDETEYEDNDKSFFIESVEKPLSPDNQAYVTIATSYDELSSDITFKIDTGAQVNIITEDIYRNVGFPMEAVTPTTASLLGYGGQKICGLKGTVQLQCRYKQTDSQCQFYVVDTDGPPVIGLQLSQTLNIIKIAHTVDKSQDLPSIVDEFKDVFEGLGAFPGEHEIRTNPEISPCVNAPRNVPVALRDKVRDELTRMENMDVLEKVEQPTPWVSSMVVVEKPKTNSVRICLDPKELNKAVMREHHRTPTLEDVSTRLSGAKFFIKLDARRGYWQIKLTEESSFFTTFNTPYGRYRFKRLPFGIHSAQDVFQKRVDETFEGLEGVEAIIDDILIHGRTKDEHDNRLRKALERARLRGIKLNKEKCLFGVTEVTYFGHSFTSEGLMPDPDKVAAIRNMQKPTCKEELQTILGMITYLGKFVPNLSDEAAPLRNLIRKDAPWIWDAIQDNAFSRIKSLLTQQPGPVLKYFDPQKEITLQVDASKYGLGAVLLQDELPVSFASRTLSQSEQNYAQIEKELLAICFGIERHHQFVYGQRFLVQSDHRPLEFIFRKPLNLAPPRLQRMLLRLQKYHFDVAFTPGKLIPVADALSRHPLPECSPVDDLDIQVHTILSSLPISDDMMVKLQMETSQDPQLAVLYKTIRDGWPNERSSCPKEVTDFWSVRDELSIAGEIILRGTRMVIPTAMRKEILHKLHVGHMGIEKSKRRARDTMFWPGMSSQITDMITKCSICINNQMSNQKEPLMPHDIPARPWQVVGTDLFVLRDTNYIVVVDYYSRFLEVSKLDDTKSSTIIRKLKSIFVRHGIPEMVKSDNGPQYASSEFSTFAREWNFQHITSSPRYPRSNGLAEKSVQTLKRLMSKSIRDKQDPYLALLEYLNTPIDDIASPAQMLMSRRLRSTLPSTHEQLAPKVVSSMDARKRIEHKQFNQKRFHDVHAKYVPPLHRDDITSMQLPSGKWTPVKVTGVSDTPRSYNVITETGASFRRNRSHLGRPLSITLWDESTESISPRPIDSPDQSTPSEVPRQSDEVPQPITHSSQGERQPSTYTSSGRAVFKPNRYLE